VGDHSPVILNGFAINLVDNTEQKNWITSYNTHKLLVIVNLHKHLGEEMRLKLLVVTIALIFIAGGIAIAQPPAPPAPMAPGQMGPGFGMHRGPGGGMGWNQSGSFGERRMDCTAGLELTDKQKTEIAKLKHDHQRAMLKQHEEMAGMQAKIKLLITDDKFNESALNDAAKKTGKFHEEMILARVKHMRQIRDLLTPEQRLNFDRKVIAMDGPGHGKGPGMGMKGRRGMGKHKSKCQ